MSLTAKIKKAGHKAKPQKDGSILVAVRFTKTNGRETNAWYKVWTYREALDVIHDFEG